MSVVTEIGRPIRLHSKKFDGSPHYTFPGHVLDETADRLMIHVPVGAPIDSYRGQWDSGVHMVNVYWAARHYNLSVSWYPDWRPRAHYVNIATPATWTSTGVHTIDLDLDLIRRADEPQVVLDDADEFEHHRRIWRYPDDLVETCWAAVREVTDLFHRAVFPFARSIHTRPAGVALTDSGA